MDGISGLNCVLSGLVVTGGSDMTPSVAKGSVLSNGVMFAVAAGDVTITAADATHPRIDLIVVNSSGALAVRAGTPAASPVPPVRTANDVAIAAVYVPANDTTIATNQLKDLRARRERGPICIYKTTTAETTNTTASAIECLNKANSGVTIPSGLFLAGRVLRVRVGGNMLINGGAGNVTVAIKYGGTTMFSDTSAGSTNDTDRRAWFADFTIVAQGNSDQALVGHLQFENFISATTAPGTGIGDMWQDGVTSEGPVAVAGSAAVDSDAANRLLSFQITFQVSSASNEVVVEYASVDIV
jgi:hypothetical protein